LLAASTLITYISGLLIDWSNRNPDEQKKKFQRKLWVFLSFSSNLALLFFFKYFKFALNNINLLFSNLGLHLINPAFDILLPIGISFYTFQALSYTMDIYRGEINAQKNIVKYALFVSFFPQLVAGPIERSKNLLTQVNKCHLFAFDYDRAKSGFLLMLWGYFQKVVIADRLAVYVNAIYADYSKFSGLEIAIASIFFAFQIYCDFAGYTNIARGAAKILGFDLMLNFNSPYLSISIQDFWRRWHISLSTWFRDYLYIPLGGSRCSKLRKYINVMITFLASGLWHGAAWNFIIWGGLHGLYQLIGQITKPYKNRLYTYLQINQETALIKTIKIIIVFILADFALIFFRAPSAKIAFVMIGKILAYFEVYLYLILLISLIFILFRLIAVKKSMKFYLLPLIPLLSSGIGIMIFRIFTEKSIKLVMIEAMQKEYFIASIILILFLMSYEFIRQYIGSGRQWLAKQNAAIRWSIYYLLIFIILIFGIYGPGYSESQFIYFQF
jgi:D-alanyl-lipoteichoic acid acyltransferase DltB (MBOAT superfamily)